MSKYIDSLKSESPASLYVFDQNPPGIVTDLGWSGNDLTLIEETGVTAKAAPSIIPGVRWSVWLQVANDGTTQNESHYENLTYSEWASFATLDEDVSWTWEGVVMPGLAEVSDATFYGNLLWGFVNGNVSDMGVHITSDGSGNWRLSFRLYFEDPDDVNYNFSDIYDVITHDLGPIAERERLHIVTTKVSRTFRMYVNGVEVGSYEYGPNAILAADSGWNSDQFHVGGVNASFRHSDAEAIGAVALIRTAVPYENIEKRYKILTESSEDVYETIVGGFGPAVVMFPSGNGLSTLQPELDHIAAGMDEVNLRYLETDQLTIEPSKLGAGAVTFYKKQYFDLSSIDFIGRVYHNFTSTTGANSSVTAEYSFDDAAYSALPTGENVLKEITQVWAQAAEGTL